MEIVKKKSKIPPNAPEIFAILFVRESSENVVKVKPTIKALYKELNNSEDNDNKHIPRININ